jgi:outer membrane biosynthesis protein TonB
MMRRRLMWAVIISAGVHLAVLVMLLGLSVRPGRPSVLRVRVLPSGGAAAELRDPAAATEARLPGGPVAASAPRPELSRQPAPFPARASVAPAMKPSSSIASSNRPPAPDAQSVPAPSARAPRLPDASRSSSGDGEPATAARQPIPVQSDIWVLTPTADGAANAPETPGPETSGQPTERTVPPPGKDAGAGGGGSGGRGANAGSTPLARRSLLAELGRRLAQSAARCTPSEAARHGWSKDRGLAVPVHFCLDAAGRPSDVGLQGSTGSDLLDRAARDCVVPGAVPLPPAPGCYTVPVLFPVRG